MQELDEWTSAKVIEPLLDALQSNDEEKFHATHIEVERAIRAKVLESYHNGQAAKRPTNAHR